VGVIIADQYNGKDVNKVLNFLEEKGMQPEVISTKLGLVKGSDGSELEVDHTFLTCDSVLFDALYVVGGKESDRKFDRETTYFVEEAFDHFKPIGATHDGAKWLKKLEISDSPGVVAGEDMKEFASSFIEAISAHRHWNREKL
jgi:catalase